MKTVSLFAVVLTISGCSSVEGSGGTTEFVGSVSQALGEEKSGIKYTDNGSNFWESSYGPDAPETPGNVPKGICAIDYIRGGFKGRYQPGSPIEYGDFVRIVVSPTTHHFRLELSPDVYGYAHPAAQMTCTPLSKFSNTTHAYASVQQGAETGYASHIDTTYLLSSGDLHVWAGVTGFVGSGATANTPGQYNVSKFFSTTNEFSQLPNNAPDTVYTANSQDCPASPPADSFWACLTTTKGWNFDRRNSANVDTPWTRALGPGPLVKGTDIIAKNFPSTPSTRSRVSNSALSGMFCFLSGIAGNFDTDASAAMIATGTGGTADVLVTGDFAEAAASCIPYAQ